jgi:tRNA threonylcarbamoyladenosine biosynthesis protein TsaB
MPLCLAIDTSTRQTGVALADGELLEWRRFSPPREAGTHLLPAIHDMLQGHGRAPEELDVVIVAIGPGSFTGLRIGLATAKGLAHGGRAALVPVSTLETLAWQAPTRAASVLPLVEARRGEVFTARWRRLGEALIAEEDPRRVAIADLLAEAPDDALLIGPALAARRADFLATGRHLALAGDADCALSLPWLVELGMRRWERQGGEDPDLLEPDYLFEFQPTPAKARA